MIDIDAIASRLDRGLIIGTDVQAMVAESLSMKLDVPVGIIERMGRGYMMPSDAHALFDSLEIAYQVAYKRPTGAERRSAELAFSEAEKAKGDAQRQKDSAIAAAAAAMAQADLLATAQEVDKARADAAAKLAADELAQRDADAAATILAQKSKTKTALSQELQG